MALRDEIISAEDLPARLAALPGWHGDTTGITRDYPSGWDTAAAMVADIAPLAVEMEHRPDLDVRWSGLHVFLTTHTAGDVVTELDLAMAARLDAIAAAHGVTGLGSVARPSRVPGFAQMPRQPGKRRGIILRGHPRGRRGHRSTRGTPTPTLSRSCGIQTGWPRRSTPC